MAAEFGDAAAEAAHLASRIHSDASKATSVTADLGKELPSIKHVLETLKAIRDDVETVKIHRDELRALEQRCTYIAVCAIIKSRQSISLGIDVTPLEECVQRVRELVERCGASGKVSSTVKSLNNENEIARLTNVIRTLETGFSPTGEAALEGNTRNTRETMVSLCRRCCIPPVVSAEPR